MERVCGLGLKQNSCPHLGANRLCNAPNTSKCGFIVKLLDKQEEKVKYERKEKWYEKYYKR